MSAKSLPAAAPVVDENDKLTGAKLAAGFYRARIFNPSADLFLGAMRSPRTGMCWRCRMVSRKTLCRFTGFA